MKHLYFIGKCISIGLIVMLMVHPGESYGQDQNVTESWREVIRSLTHGQMSDGTLITDPDGHVTIVGRDGNVVVITEDEGLTIDGASNNDLLPGQERTVMGADGQIIVIEKLNRGNRISIPPR